jgi:predicted DsbA family dithiol-disulfide isomerase
MKSAYTLDVIYDMAESIGIDIQKFKEDYNRMK